jgi:peptidoglycan biosynthesis protein MviN/MurJ (putative lipid II flippase)
MRAGGLPLGVFGLALGAGIAAWVEWWLLRRRLTATIGPVNARIAVTLRTFAAAAIAAAAGYGVKSMTPELPNILRAVIVCGTFGGAYLGTAAALGMGEAQLFADRLRRILKRRR